MLENNERSVIIVEDTLFQNNVSNMLEKKVLTSDRIENICKDI